MSNIKKKNEMNGVAVKTGIDDLLDVEELVISPEMSAHREPRLAEFVSSVIREVAVQFEVEPMDVYFKNRERRGVGDNAIRRAQDLCMRKLWNAGMTYSQIGEVWRMEGCNVRDRMKLM